MCPKCKRYHRHFSEDLPDGDEIIISCEECHTQFRVQCFVHVAYNTTALSGPGP